MTKEQELQQLREKCSRILKSPACLEIRFKFANVLIQRYMYAYIGHSILTGAIPVAFGDGNAYDHECNTLMLESLDVRPATIVHEATHAIHNATNVGKVVTKGVGEAVAYLAEALWALNSGEEVVVDIPPLERPIRRLALMVRDYNLRSPSGSFRVPADEVWKIQSIMKYSSLNMEVDREYVQLGIGDGPTKFVPAARCSKGA